MKNILLTTIVAAGLTTGAAAQPVLVSGFNGMAGVNGTAYSKTTNVGTPGGAYQFVCSSNDRMRLYASSFYTNYLYYVDPATFTITDSMSHEFYHISASNEPNTVFARISTGLARIDAVAKSITDSISIPNPFYVKERPNSKEVWVVNNSSEVYVVNYTSGLTATPFMAGGVGSGNGEVTFTSGGTIAYKLGWTSKRVYKIDAATKTVLDSVTTPGLNGIAVSGDSSKIFVSDPNNFKIRIYNTATMTIVDSINCGTREPFELYRHPDRAEIWAVNHFKDSITVFNESTYAQIAAFDVTASPHFIAFGISATATNTVSAGNEIAIYPNPATAAINITGAATGAHITVYNIAGQVIGSTVTSTGNATISLAGNAAGTYFVQVCDKAGKLQATKNIVKN